MNGEASSHSGEPSSAMGTRAPDRNLVDIASRHTTLRANALAIIHYRNLIRQLVLKDLKLKYRGSTLGFVWSLLNPLLMVIVYTIAFKYIIGVRGSGFVSLLLIGVLAWTFFAASTAMSAGAIVDNGGVLKTVSFPRAVLPIATVMFNLAQFLLTAAVFLPLLALIYGTPPRAPALLFPVFIVLQLLLTAGVALAVATGTSFFRDLRHLLDIALAMMFWTTPIVYDFRVIPDSWRWPVLLSPMSPYVLAYQNILYHGTWPPTEVWALAVLYAAAGSIGGAFLFARFQDRFVERI
jgi:ABC-2 type transport system permease protein